jgi:ATP-dependent protease ClpP protease subunit
MKTVSIDGDIGYSWYGDGVTAKDVKKQLEGLLDGEEIQVEINSPGGSVYEGICIFNTLRDQAKTHPVSVRINCMAMSMASYIALAARTVNKNAIVEVSNNSIFMIHQPWMVTFGNYHDLAKDSEYLEKLSALYGSVHAAVSGQSDQEIQSAMDEETFYVGREIIDAGFANSFDAIVTEDDASASANGVSINSKDNKIINAKIAANKTMENARAAGQKDSAAYRSDIEKAVAFYQGFKPPAAASGEKINKPVGGSKSMKPEELLAQDKTCYEAVFALGEKAALEKERARVSAHIMLGKEAGSLETAVKYIEGGESTLDEKIRAEYLALSMKNARIEARNADEPGDINVGTEGEADAAAIAKAFREGVQGKKTGGGK